MNEDLIEAIEALTEAVRNLNGNVDYLSKSLSTSDDRVLALGDKLEKNSKALDKLTGEVNALRFK